MTIRKKRKFKAIISTFLCLALLGGAVFGVTKLLKNDSDTVEIKNSAFSVGALDEEGEYVENKQTLYTKEMFRCDGLTVDLAKNCKSTYQIFFYDEDGDFIEATEVLSEDFEEDIADGAVNARVMITPEIPEDKTAEDFKINFFTKYSYLKGITITVNKPLDSTEDNGQGGDADKYADNLITGGLVGYRYELDVENNTINRVEDSKYTTCYFSNVSDQWHVTNVGTTDIYLFNTGSGGGEYSLVTLAPGETGTFNETSRHNGMDNAIWWETGEPTPYVH